MCIIETSLMGCIDGTYGATIRCKISGKPISTTNKYGMFCEDLCGYEEEKRIWEDVFGSMKEIFGDFFDKVK